MTGEVLLEREQEENQWKQVLPYILFFESYSLSCHPGYIVLSDTLAGG
jgi:hypothetical protein